MMESAHTAFHRALTEIASRRAFLGAAIAGSSGVLVSAHDGDAKKKKHKKRCMNDTKR